MLYPPPERKPCRPLKLPPDRGPANTAAAKNVESATSSTASQRWARRMMVLTGVSLCRRSPRRKRPGRAQLDLGVPPAAGEVFEVLAQRRQSRDQPAKVVAPQEQNAGRGDGAHGGGGRAVAEQRHLAEQLAGPQPGDRRSLAQNLDLAQKNDVEPLPDLVLVDDRRSGRHVDPFEPADELHLLLVVERLEERRG